MSRLYRQIYLYTLLILILSLVLSGISMSLLFGQREQGLLSQAFKRQVYFIRRELVRTEERAPEQTAVRLQELGEQLGWDVAYWRAGQLIYSSVKPAPERQTLGALQYLLPGQPLHLSPPYKPQLAIALDKQQPEQAVLWLRVQLSPLSQPLRGPFLALVFLLLFLALLLIPLTRFLLRPYRDLQSSIEYLAEGHFDGNLDAKKYPAFRELAQAFNQMQLRLQQMLQQKQRLVADVSHELRSPLTRLRLKLELLPLQEPADQQMLARAVAEIEELDRIIDDVLEISRLQLHALPLKLERVDLSLLLFDVVEQHADWLEQKGLELNVQLPDHSVYLNADSRLLKRVLNNLFSNLIKYVTGPGQVDLQLQETADQLKLTLRDRGPGIPAESLQHIFTPFHRLDPSRSRRTGGVGLGLAIVWEIIQSHQGQIEAYLPQDGAGGLAFCITLPHRLQLSADESKGKSLLT